MDKYLLLMVIPMVVMCTPTFYTTEMRDDFDDDDEAADIVMARAIPRQQIDMTPPEPNGASPNSTNDGVSPTNNGDTENDGVSPTNNEDTENDENTQNDESPPTEEANTENSEEEEEEESGDKIVDVDDINDDPEKETDILKINTREQNRTGVWKVITDPERPGWHLAGDIWFSECEQEDLFNTTNYPNPECENRKKKKKNGKRDATTLPGKKWTFPIPYQLDSSLGGSAKTAIQDGMNEIKAKSCVTFEKTTATNKDYFWFHKGKGCSSHVGRTVLYHKHKISIGSGCESKSTATHEMMHALGFWHEQQRADRDTYVTINYENIDKHDDDPTFNFNKKTSFVDTYGYDYDYRSVMHYKKNAFGKPYPTRWAPWGYKETITPKIKTDLGQSSSGGLSKIDALQLNERYCNDVKTTIDRDVLMKEQKRWMAIYEHDSNDDFREELFKHFEKIYPEYYITASVYDGVHGWYNHAYRGWCGHVWRQYNKNTVLCYSRRTSRFPSQSEKERIIGEVVDALEGQGCNSETIMDAANKKAESFGYPILAVHAVVHGSGLRTKYHTVSTIAKNFNCDGDKQSTLIVVFGSL